MAARPGALPHFFFDLDGTLADSLHVLRRVYDEFLAFYGKRGSDAEFDRLNGPTTFQVIDHLRRSHGIRCSRTAARERYFEILKSAYLAHVRPAPGAVKLLKYLRRQSAGLHLVTASIVDVARPWLRAYRLDTFFKTTTFGGEVRRGKPDPAIYERAFDKAGLRPGDERIVVEDSTNGCLSAKRAASPVVRVGALRASARGGDRIEDLGVPNLTGLEQWIRRGGWKKICYVAAASQRIRARLTRGASGRKGPDRLLCLDSVSRERGVRVYSGRYRPYWDFIGALRAGRPHPPAMAVGGLVTVGRGADRKYLVGLRSRHVAVYPLTWEWVPAGGIDTDAIRPDGSIDLARMITKEFEEETGLDRALIQKISVFGVIHDRATNSYDFCMHMELKSGAEHARLAFPKKEYVKMKFLDEHGVRRFARSGVRIISTFGPAQRAFRLTLGTKGK